ncbi:macrophage colony-stimulating factor 1 receptor-like [Paramacrobiotus metropolitanus]|uniref:macrophage colony-stimulating factor 1 receptor-like n=1 Tax=Paramacrobiotus metropolitanus TaxID=2943436 RepID=UPI002445A629|nr:macrophage colony-stimulating factor 1 receptor-like [Paramacrobiotus metropolitanus]
MQTYFLLWNSTDSNTTRSSGRMWQDVQLDLCIKFPFKLVFEVAVSSKEYIAAMDDIRLEDECMTLEHGADCADMHQFIPLENIPVKKETGPLLAPAPSGSVSCQFELPNFCGWSNSHADHTVWNSSASPSGKNAVIARCDRVQHVQITSYLSSPRTSCDQSKLCYFEFGYRSSEGKVVKLQLWMAFNETFPAHLLWDSGVNIIPDFVSVAVNLTNSPAIFWLSVAITFFEDATTVELTSLQFYRNDSLVDDKPDYLIITICGNLVGILCIIAILGAIFVYRRSRAKLEYSKRVSLCGVPFPLLEEFELPTNSVTLENKQLRPSHFCHVGFARITKPHDKHFGSATTLAIVKFLSDRYTPEEERYFLAEMGAFMLIGRHINIVSLIGVILKDRPMIVMEYCANGSLLQYLHNDSNYVYLKRRASNQLIQTEAHRLFVQSELQSLLSIIHQMASGMEFLSSRGFLHRDLAARNVLLDSGLIAKIGDFGLARNDSEYILQRQNVKLPLGWMAPETLVPMEGRYSEKSDIWSFGVVVWECFTFGKSPFEQEFPRGIQWNILLDFIARGERLLLPDICPQWMAALVSSCWSIQPEDRPEFREILLKIVKNSNCL